MKQFLDFVPIIAFLAAFYLTGKDVLAATAVLIGAQTLVMGIVYLRHGSLDKQMQITFWIVLGLGGLTLILKDATFIQWKPTIVNWLLACGLLGSQFIGERNLIERMLGHQMTLPREIWRTLAWGWSLGFFVAGVLNLVVAYRFSMEFWVNYKLFGGLGLTLFYTICTVVYIAAKGHLEEPEAEAEADAALDRTEP